MRTMTVTPIGTLTRKIQCQLSVSVRTPPRSTPRLPPPAITKPKMPIAFARSACSVKRFIISDSATAEPLDSPRCNQKPWRRGHAARDRGNGEERDADQEQPAVAEEVTKPAAEQEEAAERQEVRIHDPRERRLREAEVFPDRRERNVHDRRIEDDHQVAKAEDVEREPASAVIQGHVWLPPGAWFSVGLVG